MKSQLLIKFAFISIFLPGVVFGELNARLTTTGGEYGGSGTGVTISQKKAIPISVDATVHSYISASLDGCFLHWEIYRPGTYKARASSLEVETNLPFLVIMAEGVGHLKKEGKWLTSDMLEVSYALTEDPEHEPEAHKWKTPEELATHPFLMKQMGADGKAIFYLWAQVCVDENDLPNKDSEFSRRPYKDLRGFRLTLIQLPTYDE